MKFDNETDILVVGSGAAAFSAAITARKNGASVIMLEKAPLIGGTTLRSGGGYWIPNNRFQKEKGITDTKSDALRYMARYSYPQLYNPQDARLGLPENEYALIDTYFDKASEMVEFLGGCGAVKSIQEINWLGKPQVDYMDHLPENKEVRGRVLYSQDKDGKMAYGGELVRQMRAGQKRTESRYCSTIVPRRSCVTARRKWLGLRSASMIRKHGISAREGL